jgi:hypothetical protein
METDIKALEEVLFENADLPKQDRLTVPEIASLFGCCVSRVAKTKQQLRLTMVEDPSLKLDAGKIVRYALDNPEIKLVDIGKVFNCSTSYISMAMSEVGCARKGKYKIGKVSPVTREQAAKWLARKWV